MENAYRCKLTKIYTNNVRNGQYVKIFLKKNAPTLDEKTFPFLFCAKISKEPSIRMISLENLYDIFLKHPLISIDSRRVEVGSLFFALKGERFDGNEFAAAALAQGAAYAIIDNPAYQKSAQYLLVEDVLTSLQQLATYHRRQFHIPILAITGSNGKTTTKELISRVLASRYPTHFTQGNLNNHIGVPLTLLRMPAETEVAVIEMGANHQGEIDSLCHIAKPTHGVLTNIGKAHLEGFGGFEGVKKGKGELYNYLARTGGMAFVNSSEPFLRQLAESVRMKLLYNRVDNKSPEQPFEVQLVEDSPFVKAIFLSSHGTLRKVESQLTGIYNFSNIMAAIVIGKYFKVPSDSIKEAIESYVPANMRSQWVQQGTNRILLDAYNANPTSMRHAIEHFARMNTGDKVAIVGDMLELGEESLAEHQAIVDLLVDAKFTATALVGKEFAKTNHPFLHFDNADDARNWLEKQQFKETHILIKGSRGIQLEKVLQTM